MLSNKTLTALLATLLLLAAAATGRAGEEGVVGVEGTAKADKLDSCVAETPFMRRNHFELILHQRDITVHEGIRKTDNSLANCVDCHARRDASGAFVPVDADEEFCSGCHERAAVSIDCFSCHNTVPDGD